MFQSCNEKTFCLSSLCICILFISMRGANGVSVPRISTMLGKGKTIVEPKQEQQIDASLNVCMEKENYPIAQNGFFRQTHHRHELDLIAEELLNPTPLCVIPCNESYFPSHFVEQKKSISSPRVASDADILAIGYSALNTDGEPADASVNGQQILPCLRQIPDRALCAIAEPYSPVIFSQREARNQKDKLRKARISQGIRVLRSNVPCFGFSDKGDEASVLDDTIDYIKYLKLQLKLLSQSRLSGESTAYPFVHLEGRRGRAKKIHSVRSICKTKSRRAMATISFIRG
ncbi:uncharacterized protein LOC109843722 isoform X2 [Asparagus officinalis]|uniref:uncharacterized protein LOC109843722 isoform X2 n=2 Tax=Asparagus officinalis TaxID=4686 RepID=UPI00098E70B6|nr:uncharacterized protein LOC109843722 isoform X2 [Asparagus officinalis]